MDWNTLSLDQMVEYLRKKYMFSSSGDDVWTRYIFPKAAVIANDVNEKKKLVS
jgi:hypothetical protein